MKRMMVAVIILTLPSIVWSYRGQTKDEDIVRQAIQEGIINTRPFPPDERWANWVNNFGDFLSYRSNCIRRWEEVAKAADITAEQRAKAKALHEKYEVIHSQFDELIGSSCCSAGCAAELLIVPVKFGRNRITMWSPTLEWTLENDSHAGNPFDLVATVTFTHEDGDARHVTGMFYVGDDTWKFRFTATRTGKWTFNTQADGHNGTTKDDDLHDRSGEVVVSKHPDPQMRGFITHRGNKFARQVNSHEDLEGFLPATYMNQRKFGNPEGKGWTDITPTLTDPKVYEAYMDEVEAHGCNGVFVHVINQWLKAHALSYTDHDSVNPDFETFAALENAIVRAHQRGMYVHIWAWGDEARKWTPKGLPGGVNGKVDRRIQRYIAARLGPLPGWVMGYGFDLQEWTEEQDLGSWAAYLHERSGWHHMLWARGRSEEALDARSYSGYGVESYDEIVEKLESDRDRPHLFEERDTYLRGRGGLTQDGSRRFMWRQAIAGGMMGFWGHYPKSTYDKGPYPHPEQFVCFRKFWDGRFLLDMQRSGDLTDGFALATPDQKHLVFYKEDTDRITMDLTDVAGPLPLLAVDTTQSYREIKVGMLDPGKHTWQAPHKSDWAIAVGRFSSQRTKSAGLSKEKAGLQLEPCKIELVDGTQVTGQLAVQCEMDEHVVVYSPRLATVRSFLKQHIHAMVVDGKRERFNPKRELTHTDKELLGRVDWPDEPPEKGRTPAYTAETWEPPRQLLVWANPGKSGRLEEPQNWLLNGKHLSAIQFKKERHRADGDAFDLNTDILLPDADTSYTVGYSNRARGGLKARHIAIGDNAQLKASILTVAGNGRIVPRGRLRVRYTIALKGDRHTFFHNDKPPFTAEQNNTLQGGYPAANYVNGIGYSVAQYFRVEKVGLASVEFIGTTQTSDDFQMPSGVTIVAPNAQLMPGKRSTQKIGKDAVLRLHSGSQFCKAENATYYDNDLIVEGCIEAGTNENPITEDCLLGISFKDRSCYGKDGPSVGRAAPGLVFEPSASVQVNTTDPKKARLVIRWHGRENTWQRSRMKAESGKNYMAFPRKIEIEVHGQLALNAVLFDDVHGGGIKLAYPDVRNLWKNVFFGNNNDAPPDGVFNLLPVNGKKGID